MQTTLTEDYVKQRNETFYRGHTSIVHPLFKTEFSNAQSCIISYLNKTVLAQAKYRRYAQLYKISAEKCFNNSTNSYSASESLECEKLLFSKDPVLSNINDFKSHVEVALQDQYEKDLHNVNCAVEYTQKHKAFLLRTNFLYRHYYYLIARNLFISSVN